MKLPRPNEDPCTWVLLALAALLALYLAVVVPATVYAAPTSRWSPAVEARLLAAWPDVEAAADLAGVPVEDLAAQAIHETGVRPLEGQREPVLGILQVMPHVWRGNVLAAAGFDDLDLMHPVWSWYAAAAVLAYERIVYRREGALLQCVWACGNKALRYEQDCPYSRGVDSQRRYVRQTRRAVEALEVAARD